MGTPPLKRSRFWVGPLVGLGVTLTGIGMMIWADTQDEWRWECRQRGGASASAERALVMECRLK